MDFKNWCLHFYCLLSFFGGIVFFLEVFWVSACMTCCRVAWRCPFLLVHLKPLVSAAKQGPIKCLSVQYKLSRAKEPSLFSRLNSLERLRDGKPKTVVASFRAALRAYYKGIREQRAEAKKVQAPPCQAGSIARFLTTPNQGLEGESDPH